VNLSRFGKGGTRREEVVGNGKKVLQDSGGGVKVGEGGKSFKEAVSGGSGVGKGGIVVEGGTKTGKERDEVVWEVEVEADVLTRLKGSFVGVLAEDRDHQSIQRNFTMDGYQNIVVTPLGHLKVLLSSQVEGEVHELVNTVGWWCTWFERFDEWSPCCTSNYRVTWLNCFGVPLHVWGDALFRTLGFKFGTFIGINDATKMMTRCDVAKIKIATDSAKVIDSSVMVEVLGKKFVIRVIEDLGGEEKVDQKGDGGGVRNGDAQSCHGSGDGGSVVAAVVGESEVGNDSD
jgi:hypothetical protein